MNKKVIINKISKTFEKLPFHFHYTVQQQKLLRKFYYSLACAPESKLPVSIENGGVVLTFDDNFIDEWFYADSILNKYRWKATFFVSYINSLGKKQFEKLLKLQKSGHEIGGHGYNHYNQSDFIHNHSLKDYMNNEIIPMLEDLKQKTINLSSFAYPYGSRDEKLDSYLLNYFKILRVTTYDKMRPKEHNCFFKKNQIIFGLGIDTNYKHFSDSYVLELLSYAKKTKQILILYGHKPVENPSSKYETKMTTLETICNFINKNNMKFYSASELFNFICLN